MRGQFSLGIAAACAASCNCMPLAFGQAQTQLLPPPIVAPPPAEGLPNLNGVWETQYVSDIGEYVGGLPFTEFGREQWETRDQSEDPTGYCLPSGPARIWHTPFPIQIVQTEGQVIFLYEYFRDYHRVFTDGRGHPASPDSTWFGHSIGRYEQDSLIVDTVGLNDRTWLSTAGLLHSDQLTLMQVFEKSGPDSITYTVTYNDPVFFTQPWSMTTDLRRSEYDLLEWICENNRDIEHFVPRDQR